MDTIYKSLNINTFAEVYKIVNPIFEQCSFLFSKYAGKGYGLIDKRYEQVSSFLVPGSYTCIEPSILPLTFWDEIIDLCQIYFDINHSIFSGVKVQLNKFVQGKYVHPLIIYPHIDSSPSNHFTLSINIPIQSSTPVVTDFFKYKPTNSTTPVHELFMRSSNKTLPINDPNSLETISKFLLDNPTYATSKSLILKNWSKVGSICCEPGQITCFKANHFHAPRIEYSSIPDQTRNCLIIFLYIPIDKTINDHSGIYDSNTDFNALVKNSFMFNNDGSVRVFENMESES